MNSAITFDGPAVYEIRLQGAVTKSLSEYACGMSLRVEESSGSQTVTTITGCFKDQAALSGVLNALYEWHLTLLSVQRMEAS